MASGKYEFVNLGNYLFLTLLRIWAWITALFFFRRFKVTGRQYISGKGPVLFAVNHQSAFLDPVLIGITSGRKPWYLTRAAVFKGELAKFILKAIHMLPVYRPRDNVDIRAANKKTFDQCIRILSHNGSVLVFPEGNHGMLKRLRTPLKKGLARIAFEAEEENDFELDLRIIPVGINYEHPTRFRTDVLINYGEGFNLKEFRIAYETSHSEGINLLNRTLEDRMRSLMLDIHPKERYDEIEEEWQLCRNNSGELTNRFNTDREIIDRVITTGSCTVHEKKKPVVQHFIQWLCWPFFIIGMVLNLPAIVLTKLILGRTVIDPHFTQSIMFVCAMTVAPFFVLVEAGILAMYFNYYLFWVVLIPLLGVLAFDYRNHFLRQEKLVFCRKLAQGYIPD